MTLENLHHATTPTLALAGEEQYSIRPTASFSERCHAWSLVYLRYLESGFINTHPSALFFSALDLIPSTVCMVARSQSGKIGGTMSLAVNSTAGLPGGLSYEDDLRRLGIDGRVLGEITKLAVSGISSSSVVATNLMATLIYWSWWNHLDDIVCVVHPRHAKAWSSVFGWRPVGDTKLHPGVNDKPGVLLHLDLKRISPRFEGFPLRGQRLLRGVAEREFDCGNLFRPSGCEVAALLLQCPGVLSNAAPRLRMGIERHFPWAYQVISSLHNGGFTATSAATSIKPIRDRKLAYPNQISQRRASMNAVSYDLTPHDHLLFSDMPLTLLIGPLSSRTETMHQLLDDVGFIVIRCLDCLSALRVVRENLFDVILLDTDFDDMMTSALTQCIRERDTSLDFHTLVIGLPEILKVIQNSSRKLISERESLAALVATLRMIAEAGSDQEAAGDEHITNDRKCA